MLAEPGAAGQGSPAITDLMDLVLQFPTWLQRGI